MRCLLCALLLALTACGESGQPAVSGAGQLEALRGRWVVVNYWAQWCKPCIQEIPELNALERQYDGVTVVGVNYDGATGDDLERQLRQLGVAFTTLASDPATALGTTRPAVLPTTLVIDPQGRLRETLIGPQTLESLARATRQIAPAD